MFVWRDAVARNMAACWKNQRVTSNGGSIAAGNGVKKSIEIAYQRNGAGSLKRSNGQASARLALFSIAGGKAPLRRATRQLC